jgi:hypothetical protein
MMLQHSMGHLCVTFRLVANQNYEVMQAQCRLLLGVIYNSPDQSHKLNNLFEQHLVLWRLLQPLARYYFERNRHRRANVYSQYMLRLVLLTSPKSLLCVVCGMKPGLKKYAEPDNISRYAFGNFPYFPCHRGLRITFFKKNAAV